MTINWKKRVIAGGLVQNRERRDCESFNTPVGLVAHGTWPDQEPRQCHHWILIMGCRFMKLVKRKMTTDETYSWEKVLTATTECLLHIRTMVGECCCRPARQPTSLCERKAESWYQPISLAKTFGHKGPVLAVQ